MKTIEEVPVLLIGAEAVPEVVKIMFDDPAPEATAEPTTVPPVKLNKVEATWFNP
jgi:hypothetical protein